MSFHVKSTHFIPALTPKMNVRWSCWKMLASLRNLPAAKLIAKALEPFKPTWFEDPIRMNSPQALAEYARSTDVWVCASETLGSRWAYK